MKKTHEKDPTYKTTIGAQFEYNRFTRDFFEDPNNKGKSKADAIAAWSEIKAKPVAMLMFLKSRKLVPF